MIKILMMTKIRITMITTRIRIIITIIIILRRAENSSHCHVFGRLRVLRNVEACTCDNTIRPAMLLEGSSTPKTLLPTLHPSHRQQNHFKKYIRQAAWILAARAGAKAGSHDTHGVTWPCCNSLGHRPENSCCGGRKVRRTAMSSEDSASSAM